jgi:hypothetical protein
VNCLENSTDLNYFIAFAVNSIGLHGCPTAISDNLFQDGTLTEEGARYESGQPPHAATSGSFAYTISALPENHVFGSPS